MRDDDKLLSIEGLEFGSGVVGVCDICQTRQAVVILTKERYKLCVFDFLNKTWIGSKTPPGAPLPAYRSERIWFEAPGWKNGRAPAIVLKPTKVVRHPSILITPDIFGITTSLIDAAIRFAREGFEVLVPDLGKTDGVGPRDHLALRLSRTTKGGVDLLSPRVERLLALYRDALSHLRAREMIDPGKSAVFGLSYGGALAIGVAAQDAKLSALALAYPVPVHPVDSAKLVTAATLVVAGAHDRWAQKARDQLARSAVGTPVEFASFPGMKHGFLSRDLSAYDEPSAELAWARVVGFLRLRLIPPPPKPPAPPVRPATAPAGPPPAPTKPAATAA